MHGMHSILFIFKAWLCEVQVDAGITLRRHSSPYVLHGLQSTVEDVMEYKEGMEARLSSLRHM